MGLEEIASDGDTQGSSGGKRKYVQPTRQEFEECIDDIDVSWKVADDANSNEIVYETHDVLPDHTGRVLRIYSTIDDRREVARSKGDDAIRTVIFDKNINRPVGGRTKTLRITTYCKNLKEKIRDIIQEAEDFVEICDECGDMMVIREGQYGEFYGCRNYPDCENTKQIDD